MMDSIERILHGKRGLGECHVIPCRTRPVQQEVDFLIAKCPCNSKLHLFEYSTLRQFLLRQFLFVYLHDASGRGTLGTRKETQHRQVPRQSSLPRHGETEREREEDGASATFAGYTLRPMPQTVDPTVVDYVVVVCNCTTTCTVANTQKREKKKGFE
jgi:hypothetical protein